MWAWLFGPLGMLIGATAGAAEAFLGLVVGLLAGMVIRQNSQISALQRALSGQRAMVVSQLAERSPPRAGSADTAGAAVYGRSTLPSAPAQPAAVAAQPTSAPAVSAAVVAPLEPVPPAPLSEPVQPVYVAADPTAAQQAVRELELLGPAWRTAAGAHATTGPDSEPLNAAPGWLRRLINEGQWPVLLGVLMALIGLGALLNYAIAEGWFTLSLPLRFAGLTAIALAIGGLGYRLRTSRRPYALALQGFALAALYLLLYAAHRIYGLLDGPTALVGVLALTAAGALASASQRAQLIAVLGALGAYAAPVLIATGDGGPVGLFLFLLVIGTAIGVALWFAPWSLLGRTATVGSCAIAALWAYAYYTPDLRAEVEPMVLALLALNIALAFVYSHRHAAIEWLLVLVPPAAAISALAATRADDYPTLAWYCAAIGALYGTLGWALRRNQPVLSTVWSVLGIGVASAALPVGMSAPRASALLGLEAIVLTHFGLRQQVRFLRVLGLLALLVAGLLMLDRVDSAGLAPLVVGLAALAVAGLRDARDPNDRWIVPTLLLGMLLMPVGVLVALEGVEPESLRRNGTLLLYGAVVLTATLIARQGFARLAWLRAEFLLLLAPLALISYVIDDSAARAQRWLEGGPLLDAGALLMLGSVWLALKLKPGSLALTATLVGSWAWVALEVLTRADDFSADNGWVGGGLIVVGAVGVLAAPPAARWVGLEGQPGWPRAAMALLLLLTLLVCVAFPGGDQPWAYLFLLNPLELAAIAGLFVLYRECAPLEARLRVAARALAVGPLALLWWTAAALRAVSHQAGLGLEELLTGAAGQAALSLAWGSAGLALMLIGHASRLRMAWWPGAVLMALTAFKMLLIDRIYLTDLWGIVAFLAVGGLLALVGYFAPAPPREAADGARQ